MKLILCPICDDVIKLKKTKTSCECKASYGRYLNDGIHATIGGAAIAIGLDNHTLGDAVVRRFFFDANRGDFGPNFIAFVFPQNHPHLQTDERRS